MLEKYLAVAVIGYLEDISLPAWTSEGERKIINYLRNKKVIDDSQIEGALEKAVFKRARQDFELLTSKDNKHKDIHNKIFPDHVPVMSRMFAYALEKGEFSRKEIRKIEFDHDWNAKDFIKSNGIKNLLSVLKETILKPRTPMIYPPSNVKAGEYVDPHPVCWCD